MLENGLLSTCSLLLRNAVVTGGDKDGRGTIYRKRGAEKRQRLDNLCTIIPFTSINQLGSTSNQPVEVSECVCGIFPVLKRFCCSSLDVSLSMKINAN